MVMWENSTKNPADLVYIQSGFREYYYLVQRGLLSENRFQTTLLFHYHEIEPKSRHNHAFIRIVKFH